MNIQIKKNSAYAVRHCNDYLGATVAAKNEKFWKILHSNFQFKNKNNNNKR